MKKRKNHSANFKARVALEAILEELTLSDLAKKYGVHANQISTWKRAAIDNMTSTFERRWRDPDMPSPADIEKLHSFSRQGFAVQKPVRPRLASLSWSAIFWPPLVHEDMHCRSVDASVQLLGTRPSRDLAFGKALPVSGAKDGEQRS